MSEWQFAWKKALMHSEEDSQSLDCLDEQNQVKYVSIYYPSAPQGLSLLNPRQRDTLNVRENDLIQFPKWLVKFKCLLPRQKDNCLIFRNKCTFTFTNEI